MAIFVAGQRWISETELDQGLGTVLKIEERRLTLFYSATGETRLYQLANCPLYRMIFSEGDTVISHEGWSMVVTSHTEDSGLITYIGIRKNDNTSCALSEVEIDGQITFTKPQQRMLAGQLSKGSEFNLRYQLLNQYQAIKCSPLLGLGGNRISLIDHQLHIAKEVGDRFSPRVLLADEVGLGKTIEAGMIINRQLLTGKAQRILIIVPETLVHQWLVEMMRRFNLHLNLFNEELYNASSADNPFESCQLVLISLEFISSREDVRTNALKSAWDLLVIDEAHHLQWSKKNGPSAEYILVESLAQQAPSILLLTATPEQLGLEGHYARLRLLDPHCFPSLEHFLQQEAEYSLIANLAKQLNQKEVLSASTVEQLQTILGKIHSTETVQLTKSVEPENDSIVRKQFINALLDQYGISRVLFRNTRSSVKGFPTRISQSYPLETPELYTIATSSCSDNKYQLYPEIAYQSVITQAVQDADPWWKVDPRVEWLGDLLRLIKNKVLVICANATTAIDLENSLRIINGQHAAVFHEEMSIIERDRAAAWFSDMEYGAQLLICSEIGSEGRNFQFAHHLILFDLPYNPDLLEQRIGRLDRIGQEEVIKIHIPYLQGMAQEKLYRWYHEGLNAFNQNCPSAGKVFAEQKALLEDWIFSEKNDCSSIIEEAKLLSNTFNQELNKGRDFLIELSSAGAKNNQLIEKIIHQHNEEQLKEVLEGLFDCFGVDIEEHSQHAFIIQPSNHMRMSSYPGLPAEGATVTFNRDMALSREDMQFISSEHPMIKEGIEFLLMSDIGNTAVSLLQNKSLREGTMLLEAVFVTETSGEKRFHLDAFMPPSVIHTLLDHSMNNLSSKINTTALHQQLKKIKRHQARKLVQMQRDMIRKMIKKAEEYAKNTLSLLVNDAVEKFIDQVSIDIKRLATLKTVNPAIREGEMQFLIHKKENGQKALQNAILKLDSVRIIITTH